MARESSALFDKLGRSLELSDCVVCARSDSLTIGTISKINGSYVKIVPLEKKGFWARGMYKISTEVIKLDSQDTTLYLLKRI